MAQRISRAKQSIKASGVPFRMPTDEERAERLGAVLHVLYLIFNEGYASSSGPSCSARDLSNEAIRLDAGGAPAAARRRRGRGPARADAAHRRAAPRAHRTGRRADPARRAGPQRCGTAGRSPRASRSSRARSRGGRSAPYQLQAAIAAVHDEARARRGYRLAADSGAVRPARSACPTTRWSRSTAPSPPRWCTGPRPGSRCCGRWIPIPGWRGTTGWTRSAPPAGDGWRTRAAIAHFTRRRRIARPASRSGTTSRRKLRRWRLGETSRARIGASPLGLPDTLSRAPRRRRAPVRVARSPCSLAPWNERQFPRGFAPRTPRHASLARRFAGALRSRGSLAALTRAYPRGFAPRTPRHALSRAASPARSGRVARSPCSLAPWNERQV